MLIYLAPNLYHFLADSPNFDLSTFTAISDRFWQHRVRRRVLIRDYFLPLFAAFSQFQSHTSTFFATFVSFCSILNPTALKRSAHNLSYFSAGPHTINLSVIPYHSDFFWRPGVSSYASNGVIIGFG